MASTVSLVFTGDPRGAVNATKAVENSLGSLKGTTGDLEKTTGTASGGIRRHWGAISLAAGGALVAITAGAKQAGDAASDLGEQVNKTRVVFRGSEEEILSWSKTTADRIGISRRAALEATGTFGNMLVPMGIARTKAGEMSKSMVELAADMASFNNASPEETLDALRSGLAGESEPLRKFGVFLSEARVQSEALALGLAKQNEKLTESQKATARYSLLLKDTKDAQGDFARTSDSVANSERIKAAAWEDSRAQLGQGLLPVMQAFNTILGAGARFASEHATAVQVMVGVVAALAVAVLATNAAMAVYTAATVAVRAATVAWTAVQWLLNVALTANPIGVVIVALAALVAGIILAWRESETFRAIVTGAFNAVRGAAEFVLDFFRTHWKTIAVLISGPFAPLVLLATDAFGIRSAILGAGRAVLDFFRDNWKTIAILISGPFAPLVALATDAFGVRTALTNAFRALVKYIGEQIDNIVSFFRALPGRLLSVVDAVKQAAGAIGRGIFDAIVGALKDFGSVVAGILKAPINAVIDAINAIRIPGVSIRIRVPFGRDISFSTPEIDPIPDLPHLAKGTRAFSGGLAVVGEEGPEVVRLPRGSDVIPSSALRSPHAGSALAGAGVQVQIHNHFDNLIAGDAHQIGEEMARMTFAHLDRFAAYRLAF